MKVKFLLLAALAAVSMTALAEVNNSWATDKVYLDDVTIKAGETKQVAVKFNNETPYAAAQADFQLPEGLEFVQMYDEEGRCIGIEQLLWSCKKTQLVCCMAKKRSRFI